MDTQTIQDTLESMSEAFEAKAITIVSMIKNVEVIAKAKKERAAELASQAKTLDARCDWLKNYVLQNMIAVNLPPINAPYFTISVKENPWAVIIDDVTLIPSDYMRQPETPPAEPDKDLIKRAEKNGFYVPGCHLERMKVLSIK